jgi:hypothetical protein
MCKYYVHGCVFFPVLASFISSRYSSGNFVAQAHFFFIFWAAGLLVSGKTGGIFPPKQLITCPYSTVGEKPPRAFAFPAT